MESLYLSPSLPPVAYHPMRADIFKLNVLPFRWRLNGSHVGLTRGPQNLMSSGPESLRIDFDQMSVDVGLGRFGQRSSEFNFFLARGLPN